MLCFVHFDFKMCFSPQRRAIFQHLNFKKWSEADVFCAFSLQNVLLATAACNFSTAQLQKELRTCSERHILIENLLLATAACNFWFLLWPHDSAPAALTSLLFDSPDTRIIGKTQHFATSLTFGASESSFFWLSRYCIFFLLTLLHLLTLLSCDFTSSICFSSAFQLSILSEVYYLNFLRLHIIYIHMFYLKTSHASSAVYMQDSHFCAACRNSWECTFNWIDFTIWTHRRIFFGPTKTCLRLILHLAYVRSSQQLSATELQCWSLRARQWLPKSAYPSSPSPS